MAEPARGKPLRWLFAAALIAVIPRVASAEPVDITVIPAGCEQYAAGTVSDPGQAWNQLMSFAGCVQDATIARITDRAQLRPMVGQLHDALAPAIVLYLEAIEYGPPEIRLRAAFATGSASIALVTRLRSSLVAPADWSDGAAVARYRALQAELEPLLVRALGTAWVAFMVVDRTATRDPSVVRDPVTRHVVAAARAMLEQLKRVRELAAPAPAVAARTAI